MSEAKKQPLQELDLGEGLVCDPETGVCEIPGARQQPGTATQSSVSPRPGAKATTERGDR